MRRYATESAHYRAKGSGALYEIQPAKRRRGCWVEVDVDADDIPERLLRQELELFLRNSSLERRRVRMDGIPFPGSRGRTGRCAPTRAAVSFVQAFVKPRHAPGPGLFWGAGA